MCKKHCILKITEEMMKENYNRILKYSLWVIIGYVFIASIFYWIAYDQINYNILSSDMQKEENVIGEIKGGYKIEQSFTSPFETIDSITLYFATYGKNNKGILGIEIKDLDSGEILTYARVDISKLKDNSTYKINFKDKISRASSRNMSMIISPLEYVQNNSVTLYYNSEYDEKITINGETMKGTLCYSLNGKSISTFGLNYWKYVVALGIFLIIICGLTALREKQGKESKIRGYISSYKKYKFLMKQLVLRDFKTKYKRSVLGFCWSFLNPLLTMLVQYMVFSTLFKSDIDNFPVYLLTAAIFFNFFTEAVGTGLISIVGNVSLISKVYVPKYIYPISKVLSTSINLLISIIPLILTVIITGEKITKAVLAIPFGVICIVAFCIGMSFLLSAAMVFFRDTQFLWGIASLLWMYATPVFYPETIIPANFTFILKINPLYYFIKFNRIILMQGISPEPILYLQCMLFAIAFFISGLFVFKKCQGKFLLYI